jgi:hypothetical protein
MSSAAKIADRHVPLCTGKRQLLTAVFAFGFGAGAPVVRISRLVEFPEKEEPNAGKLVYCADS